MNRDGGALKILVLALVLVACLEMTGGCVKTADVLDAALMHPVLIEDFETPVVLNGTVFHTGQSLATAANTWEVTAGDVELFNGTARSDLAAFDGHQAIHLTGSGATGAMATNVPTIRKKQYTLTFHYARHHLLGMTPSRGRVEVLGAGTTLLQAEFTHDDEAFDSYRRYSGTFTADSEQATVYFTSLHSGLYGITVDAISIRAVPPPLPTPPARLH